MAKKKVTQPDQPADVVGDKPEGESIMEVQSRNGVAVATVTIPARTVEVPIAVSSIEGCAVAAVQAWNTVKGVGDADFASAQGSFQRELINSAEEVYKKGAPLAGDTSLARFEQEVARIKLEQEAAKQEAAKKAAKG